MNDFDKFKFVLKKLYEKPTLSIPIVSAYAYLIAYCFEATYLAYFHVSHQLIEVTVNTFILSLGGTCVVSFYLLSIASNFAGYYKQSVNRSPFRKNMVWLFIITSPIGLGLATIGLYQNLPISKIILLVVLIEAVILILPLVEALPFWIREYKSSTKGEFAERFNTAYEKALKQREKPLATMRFPLRVMVLILFSVIIASSIGVISGRVYATTRTTFLEMSFKSKQYVLIRSYPSERIYVPISKTNKLENGVLVQSTDTAMTDFRARGVTKLHR